MDRRDRSDYILDPAGPQQQDTSQYIQHEANPMTQQQHPLQQRYKFTPDEIRVLRECNRESFYFRSLPLGTLLGVGAYYGVRMGYLKPSVRWGAGPKMIAGSILGYFLGKFSYQTKCVEKIMQLPNSPLADMLRKQRGNVGFQESLTMDPGFISSASIATPAQANTDTIKTAKSYNDFDDMRPISSFDTESSSFSGFDYGKYDTTSQMLNDDNLPERRPQLVTSYDELRKQNRAEYESKSHPNVGGGGLAERKLQTSPSSKISENPAYQPKRNQYGDVWDDRAQ